MPLCEKPSSPHGEEGKTSKPYEKNIVPKAAAFFNSNTLILKTIMRKSKHKHYLIRQTIDIVKMMNTPNMPSSQSDGRVFFFTVSFFLSLSIMAFRLSTTAR